MNDNVDYGKNKRIVVTINEERWCIQGTRRHKSFVCPTPMRWKLEAVNYQSCGGLFYVCKWYVMHQHSGPIPFGAGGGDRSFYLYFTMISSRALYILALYINTRYWDPRDVGPHEIRASPRRVRVPIGPRDANWSIDSVSYRHS